jgi:hypothetical protein
MQRRTQRRLRVGTPVSLVLGSRRVEGVIVEERGPLAAGGRFLYRVEVAVTPEERVAFEMPEDELEVAEVPGTCAATTVPAPAREQDG